MQYKSAIKTGLANSHSGMVLILGRHSGILLFLLYLYLFSQTSSWIALYCIKKIYLLTFLVCQITDIITLLANSADDQSIYCS